MYLKYFTLPTAYSYLVVGKKKKKKNEITEAGPGIHTGLIIDLLKHTGNGKRQARQGGRPCPSRLQGVFSLNV